MSNSKDDKTTTAATLYCLGDEHTKVCIGLEEASSDDKKSSGDKSQFFLKVWLSNVQVTVPNPIGIGPPVTVTTNFNESLKLEESQVIQLAEWIALNTLIEIIREK